MKKLKIGMVGSGFIADWHHNAFVSLPDVEFAALCQHDVSGNAARVAEGKAVLDKKCAEWGIAAYPDFEALVADPSLDALIIGSINPFHFEQIVAGLNAGKHLLVEKPVVSDLAELDKIKELSASTGKVVFPAHNFVYRGAMQKAKEILASGALGRLVCSSFVSTHTISEAHATGWRAKKELGKGGALIDSGHHLVYQMLYLLGMPSALQAFCSKRVLLNMDCEDTAQLNLQFPDGSLGLIMQSWASGMDHGISGIRILGDKGSLVITDALYFNGEKVNGDVEYGDSFKRQARAFVDAIRGCTPPASTLDDVKNTLRVTFAAYESGDRVARFDKDGK